MIYLLTVKEILILSNNIYLFTKCIIIRGNYILTRNKYSFQGTVSVHSRKYILVQQNIFIQGNYIHSRKYIYLRNIYSFKFKAIIMFIQGNYIYWTLLHSRNSRNIYSKIVPSHFMIIISFTITISWIQYSYNSFRLKDEEIVDMIEGSFFNLICPQASRLYLKELLNILQTVSSCSRYTTFFRFGSRFHRQNLPISKRSPLRFKH